MLDGVWKRSCYKQGFTILVNSRKNYKQRFCGSVEENAATSKAFPEHNAGLLSGLVHIARFARSHAFMAPAASDLEPQPRGVFSFLVASWPGADLAPARVEMNDPSTRRHIKFLRHQIADHFAVSIVELPQVVVLFKVQTHFGKGCDH